MMSEDLMTTLTLDARRGEIGGPPLWAALALAALSGGLLALSYSLTPAWPAAWLAPAPVLAAAVAGPRGRTWLLGAVMGLIGGVSTLSYYLSVPGPVATAIIMLLHVLLWGGAVRFAASMTRRLPLAAAVFALPALLAGVETLVLAMSPHGSAGSLAYSQMDALPAIQVAALGGVPAIVFLALAPGAWLGLALGRLMGAEVSWRGLVAAGAVVVAVTGAALGYGVWRLGQAETGPRVAVAMLATDHFAREPEDWARVWAVYGPAAERAAAAGGILVLPEKIALLSAGEAQAAAGQVADLARRKGATVLVGLEVRDGAGRYRNQAMLAQPDGQVTLYDKQHPVPGLEARDIPGRSDLVVPSPAGRIGVAICKDMHFPDLGRGYGGQDAGLMLVPAWDFVSDAWLSDRLTALRGVESGYAIARAAREGISSLSDSRGRILAEGMSGPGMTVVTGMAPTRRNPTLYGRVGDLFGWLCLAGCGVLIALRGTPLTAPSPRRRPS
jgi:apolipoprotein N-acyltransferase